LQKKFGMDTKDKEIEELKKELEELKLISYSRLGAIERYLKIFVTLFLLALTGIMLRIM
jgi:hypothetical protein